MAHLQACPHTPPPHPPQAHRLAGRPPASLWLRVSGVQPGPASLRGAHLQVGDELAALLGQGEAQQAALAQRLAESPSLPAFLVELQNLIDQRSLEQQ